TRGVVDDVGAEKRESRLCRARLQGTARIVMRRPGSRTRAERAVAELVVADRRGDVAKLVIGADNRFAFVEIRFQRALEQVARVDQQYGAAVACTSSADISQVAAEERNAAAIAALKDAAVKIVGRDDRDGDRGPGRSAPLSVGFATLRKRGCAEQE